MDKIRKSNAKITSTMLGIEDHGIFSFNICLQYDKSSHQCIGSYCLDKPIRDEKGVFIKREATSLAGKIIMRILEVVGVEKWEDLPNKYIRVKYTFDKIYEIGNLLEDKWLNFEKFFKEVNNA